MVVIELGKKMNKKITKLADIWGEFDISGHQTYYWKIGEVRLWVKHDGKEILIAHKFENEKMQDSVGKKPPSDISWIRWTFPKEVTTIKILPSFPDRPVVVKPESSFNLAKRTGAQIYVRVPLWISVHASKIEKETKILETPSVILSNTWFGDFFEGDLCYWISSGARTQIEPDIKKPYMAISPVHLLNQSDDELFVEKLALRVTNSTVYSDGQQLWSDQIRINYKGKDAISEVKFSGKPPKQVAGAALISPPRNIEKKNLLLKTFASMLDLNSLGLPIR